MEPERAFDIVLSLTLIVVLSPLIVLAVLAAALFVGLPPFYVSGRIGRGGVPYRHVKIRTMKPGPEYGRAYFEEARLNRVGRFLRRFHLDELPELFLILDGRLSFVGPRPLPARFLVKFDCPERERVRPGWTGLAQVKLLRRGILLGPEQIRLDGIYVRKRSLWYNLRIMAATFASFRRRREAITDPRYNDYRRNFGIAEKTDGYLPPMNE
jgi:lipopolysaccharide/colanic/teichoic acid biosynthesis glycosyltransferase